MVSVFIVEDEIILLEIYRNILELKGHEVVGQAHDGLECINKILGNKKDKISVSNHQQNCDLNIYEGFETIGIPETVILNGKILQDSRM